MFKTSKDHLNNVKESYWEHFCFAFGWGWRIMEIGMVSIIHAIVPAFYKLRAPEEILKLALMIKEKHPDLYEKYFGKNPGVG